ncbi:transposase, partial [Shigella boydii]
STLKSPSYTKSVSWQHYQKLWKLHRIKASLQTLRPRRVVLE